MNKKTINSSFFTSIPSFDNPVEQLINKGKSDNKIGGYIFDKKSFKKNAKELKKSAHLSIRDLGIEQMDSLKFIIETLKYLAQDPEKYDLAVSTLEEIFHAEVNPQPGTLAGFFSGCFFNKKFSGPGECNPQCLESIKEGQGQIPLDECEDTVLIYKDGTFSTLHESDNRAHVYIYLPNHSFQYFKTEDIETLKQSGVKRVTLIFSNEDGSLKETTSIRDVESLPLENCPNGNNNNNNSWAWIIFLIFFIIIIIIIFVCFYIGDNSTKTTSVIYLS